MASSSATSLDTIINLKITHDGVVKKLKLPLRDMGASTLEPKICQELGIDDSPRVLERYSDSAGSFVVLDPGNASVFKQLYRAAKAKQKLKLRVTTCKPAEDVEVEEPKPSPRPVTIEDVPEVPEASPSVVHVENAAASSDSPALSSPKPPAPVVDLSGLDYPSPRPIATSVPQASAASASIHAELESLLAAIPEPAFEHPPAVLYSRFHQSGSLPGQTEAKKPASPLQEKPQQAVPQCPATHRPPFAVYCNSCDKTIPSAHYHCSTCDDGDFDLCQACVDMGISCYGDDHWLIKRVVVDGSIVTSTTERKAPKNLSKAQAAPAQKSEAATPPQPASSRVVPVFRNYLYQNVRTCNNCVQEFQDSEFVHCTNCSDFDLCKSCFFKDDHGHHPGHGFVSAVEGTPLEKAISSRLAPGRNYKHNAICDGCDKFIAGIRHKCLDCPDWDYCADCVVNAGFVHPNHRFVPIYEALRDMTTRITVRPTHTGITCDGPLCRSGRPRYIMGDRYKCTICHDTDFCASCEASPANTHNKTHPLLKFKTPVRGVNVVTTGEHENGKQLPVMGDRARASLPRWYTRATETSSPKPAIAASSVHTVVDVKPVAAPVKVAEPEEKPVEQKPVDPKPVVDDLLAVYERDTVADGTILPTNHIFEQTWILRNVGKHNWPAGCSVKFVGGDYMGHVDSNHPAGVKELVSAFESTICYQPLAPGQTFPFTVLLRTPPREGKIISYWRLTTASGHKFGDRLWCDVEVKAPAKVVVEETKKEHQEPVAAAPVAAKDEEEEESQEKPKLYESIMIFPKLDKESPVASVANIQDASPAVTAVDVVDAKEEDGEWDESEDGFMTDEEYDILDASDEEYLDDEAKKQLQK